MLSCIVDNSSVLHFTDLGNNSNNKGSITLNFMFLKSHDMGVNKFTSLFLFIYLFWLGEIWEGSVKPSNRNCKAQIHSFSCLSFIFPQALSRWPRALGPEERSSCHRNPTWPMALCVSRSLLIVLFFYKFLLLYKALICLYLKKKNFNYWIYWNTCFQQVIYPLKDIYPASGIVLNVINS